MSLQHIPSELTWEAALGRCREMLSSNGIVLGRARILAAVSGGIDSMCMLAMLMQIFDDVEVAHMNYQTRGAASEADESLVRQFCALYQLPFHSRTIDLPGIVSEAGTGLQETGRTLRYTWFDELANATAREWICTAHHQDDSAETFFINVIRGTGLKGLTGIPMIRANILRPMLCFTRAEITHLVALQKIPYRNDASNDGHDYLRNRVRHDILPIFFKERERFDQRMQLTQQRLSSEYALLHSYLLKLSAGIISHVGGRLIIDRDKLQSSGSPDIVLHFILKEYGFGYAQCRAIVASDPQSGSVFIGESAQLFVDRDKLLLRPASEFVQDQGMPFNKTGEVRLSTGVLKLEHVSRPAIYSVDTNIEFLDGERLADLLRVRHWLPGDSFYPIGGTGRQKLQDYFINTRVARPDKSSVWLLMSGDEIAWVIGMRMDERFKITDATTQVIRAEWIPD